MDREETLRLSRLAAFGGLSLTDFFKVITEYCLEKGKRDSDIAILREYLAKDIFALHSCMTQALEYFEKKFTIYKVWSAPNPLNNQGQKRKVILIF